MEPSPPDAWKCFEEFMAGFAAARELHSRAGTAGSFVECVCLGASITDAMLRIGLVLRKQLDDRSRDIPLELIFQGSQDKAIAEREIYRRASAKSIIDDATLTQLQSLYDKRNRVIHRYVISRITTDEVLDIAIEYERMIETLAKRIYELEEQQIRDGVGITARGPSLQGEEGKRFLEDFADEKHGPSLAKVLRGK